jgi:hypothetical protein
MEFDDRFWKRARTGYLDGYLKKPAWLRVRADRGVVMHLSAGRPPIA